MKKINNLEDTQDDADELQRKRLKTDLTDQMVSLPGNSPLRQDKEDCGEIKSVKPMKNEDASSPNQRCEVDPEDTAKIDNECEDASSPHSYERDAQEGYTIGDNMVHFDTEDEGYVVDSSAANFTNEETETTNDSREVSEIYDPTDPPESYISADSSPASDDGLDKGMSPSTETASTVFASSYVEEELVTDDINGEEVQGETEIISCSLTTEECANDIVESSASFTVNQEEIISCSLTTEECANDVAESSTSFTVNQEERNVVPEVEDVTCDSGGDTLLMMKHEVCSNECEVSKSNICVEEEMTYTEQLNSIESVDEVILHTRNTVIDSGIASASLPEEISIAKCRDEHLVCEIPERESEEIVTYSSYGDVGIGSVFPKRICNAAHVTTHIPETSDSELYVYDSPVQNMVFCRESTVINASSCSLNPDLNGLEKYSFHRVPVQSCSGTRNMNDRYVHVNPEMRPIIREESFGMNNGDVKAVKKLPSDDDFMRRIEKTLYESKIENKVDDTVESKYKSELNFSLPLKKRIKTLAAISNVTFATEKCISTKEDSFPSYPVKPMISIAELEYTKSLLPNKPCDETYNKTVKPMISVAELEFTKGLLPKHPYDKNVKPMISVAELEFTKGLPPKSGAPYQDNFQ